MTTSAEATPSPEAGLADELERLREAATFLMFAARPEDCVKAMKALAVHLDEHWDTILAALRTPATTTCQCTNVEETYCLDCGAVCTAMPDATADRAEKAEALLREAREALDVIETEVFPNPISAHVYVDKIRRVARHALSKLDAHLAGAVAGGEEG